ncbi:hypothetical protein [Chromobacterium sinusclupearum]|uniref:hypothetical protein n=1 Tax=Chromobacterium sinusclupearum TaxID=2077146 RepID=UPI0011AF8008|nr:hypothetical protein [Chromobacterium sinusclupearum]
MGKESKFKNLPSVKNNVKILGSLIFNHPDLQGPGAKLDLKEFKKNPELARDLIASLYKHVNLANISEARSLGAYFAGIRDFLKYCEENNLPSDMRMKDIDDKFLRRYKSYLVGSTLHRKSERRRRRYGDITRLLEAGKTIGLWDIKNTPPRNFKCISDGDKTQPYMASELLDLEAACRNSINEICSRIERGKTLVTQGKNPREVHLGRNYINGSILKVDDKLRPWNQLPNLLWYVQNILDGRYIKNDELRNGHSSFVKSANGGFGGEYRMVDIYGHLYPLNHDMLPFLNLLEKRLGINETSLVELKRNCLRPLGAGYILDYEKRRSSKRLLQDKLYDDGPYSAVSIIKTLLHITEPLVRLADDSNKDYLFLCLTVGAKGANPVKPIDACYAKYLMNRSGGWAEQHKLKNQHGETLKLHSRALRVSNLSENYLKTGNYKKTMRKGAHASASITIKHYINNDSTKVIHDLAVADGIRSLKAISLPTVIPENDLSKATKKLSIDEEQAKKMLSGEKDVFIASCRDFLNRPGAEPNTPCDEPWGCLYCKNAVITRHVLPRLIAFRDFIVNEKRTLPPEEWLGKFGSALDIIAREILPNFLAEVVQEAERHAASMDFYIPIYFKTRQ